MIAALILLLFTLGLSSLLPELFGEGRRTISAAWLLWLIAVMVLMLNAAYRDGSAAQPYLKAIGLALRIVAPLMLVVALGLDVIVALMLTPALSPPRLAAASQYRVALETEDPTRRRDALRYLRFDAGHYGIRRLEQLAAISDHPRATELRAAAAPGRVIGRDDLLAALERGEVRTQASRRPTW
ncbi:MAG: hypothetical protein R3E75_02650 [Steroidobacteraceae bacterium]|nr:hypothetical protein [Nevskiaceae bacterium]MCP5359552.1 hypothetical protein [Nevskiaceae bacterium]MCP5473048.1 hypothetical protein [Nevskiaceae bacterium]